MNKGNVVAFADVDDNLITTTRKCPDGGRAVAFDSQGRACGFLTPKQAMFLDMLNANAQIVPVTARSTDGLRRVEIPHSGYAICSFGGVILTPAGQPEPRWHALMAAQAAFSSSALHQLLGLVTRQCEQRRIDARCRIVADAGLELFLSVKHNRKDQAELSLLKDELCAALPQGWQLHFNGNFLAAMPPFLRKEKAVAWFKANLADPGCLTIGLGDSLTDLSFMNLCDIMLTPNGSQIASNLMGETQ